MFQKLLAQVQKRIDAYILDPEDEDVVHAMRTTLRRLDSLYPLLGKKSRNANKALFDRYKEFFRSNSQIRDYDIIIARLASYDQISCQLVARLKARRRAELDTVLREAKSLQKAKFEYQWIAPEDFHRRLDKVIGRLCARINQHLPPALSDSRNKDQLHALRKDLKKLRYVLDSLDLKMEAKCRKRIEAETGIDAKLGSLKKIQRQLGEIHDSDITMMFLKSSRLAPVKELYSLEAQKRQSLYQEFVSLAKITWQ